MIKHKNRYLILGCAVLVLVFVYRSDVPRAKAITISPLTFEMTANPGDTLSNVMEVYNSEDTAIQVQMTLQDFAARGEEGKVVVVDDANETYSLAKWMTVEPQTFILGPKQRQVVNFTIRIPLNGEPGGHYGSVLAQTGSVDPSGTGATAIAQKLGTLVLLQVAGEVDEEMWIRSFEAPEFSEYGPITITSRFENIGTVHLKPQGFITITDILGRASKQVPLERKNVLPHSVRRIETPWGGKWLFGRYTATLTAIYGSTNEPLSATVTFWVLPWKILAGVGGFLLFLLLLAFKMRRRIRLAFRVIFKGEHHLP